MYCVLVSIAPLLAAPAATPQALTSFFKARFACLAIRALYCSSMTSSLVIILLLRLRGVGEPLNAYASTLTAGTSATSAAGEASPAVELGEKASLPIVKGSIEIQTTINNSFC